MVTLTARYYGFSIVYYYSYAIVVVLLPVTQRKMNGREGVIYTYWHRFLGSGLNMRKLRKYFGIYHLDAIIQI